MSHYRVKRWDALALTGLTWAMCTGLALEKVLADGVASWTMLAAMPVLTLAVAVLLHQGFDDLREWKLLRGPTAVALACICLAVTLPASIGSSGGARDTALAEAEASNRALKIAENSYGEAQRDLETAKAGVRKECVGAPEFIHDDSWPKCRWFRRAVAAYEATLSQYGSVLVTAPAEKVADSGEQRVAWALSGIASRWGYSVTKQDVALVWPMLPPIAFELLCAFFLCAALERRTTENSSVVAAEPEVVIEPMTAGEYAEVVREPSNNPTPPPSKKRTKRQQKRDRSVAWVRAYTEKHGRPPSFRVVKNVMRLAPSTASRYRKEAMAA